MYHEDIYSTGIFNGKSQVHNVRNVWYENFTKKS